MDVFGKKFFYQNITAYVLKHRILDVHTLNMRGKVILRLLPDWMYVADITTSVFNLLKPACNCTSSLKAPIAQEITVIEMTGTNDY